MGSSKFNHPWSNIVPPQIVVSTGFICAGLGVHCVTDECMLSSRFSNVFVSFWIGNKYNWWAYAEVSSDIRDRRTWWRVLKSETWSGLGTTFCDCIDVIAGAVYGCLGWIENPTYDIHNLLLITMKIGAEIA